MIVFLNATQIAKKRESLLLKTADYPAQRMYLFRNDEKLREIVRVHKTTIHT